MEDISFDFGICFASSPVKSSTNENTDLTTNDLDVDFEINGFLVNSKSKSTVYSTNNACNRLQVFMKELNLADNRNFYELSNEELDKLMCQFFMNAEKVEKE